MNCLNLVNIKRRIYAARESVQAGQCKIARSWLRKAARDLKTATTGACSTAGDPCFRALTKGTRKALSVGQKELRRSCR